MDDEWNEIPDHPLVGKKIELVCMPADAGKDMVRIRMTDGKWFQIEGAGSLADVIYIHELGEQDV